MTLVDQSLHHFLVNFQSFTLTVGSVLSSAIRAFIPFQAKPAEGIKNRSLGFLGGPGLIRVFDA